jgi:Glycosyl hydrolase catalytic core/Secretion system C-terminal sorting domain
MKRFFFLALLSTLCNISTAQLTIYSELGQQGNSGTCVARTIYKGNDMPGGLDDGIKSIALKQGFMATLASNPDGTGESFCYVAAVSDINVNLANVLRDKISFIRVLPFTNVKKKGVGEGDNTKVAQLNVGWFYDWGTQDVSLPTREFVPMAWGKGAATVANVDIVAAKQGITTYLAFNEPDNTGQANINVDEAATLYKNLLRSGYRMGSPATTEAQYRVWLSDFRTLADQDASRVDFVAVHWYDWGNWLSTKNANPDPNALFTRFKNYITAVYNLHQKPIWITEFNANINRPSAVHEAFMALALPWLDADPRVERYAYFFGNDIPAVSGGVITAAGRVYASHVSTDAITQNITDSREGATVAVLDINDASFSVYPSLVQHGKIEVSFKNVSDTANLKIFNVKGQLMSTHALQSGATAQTIDVSSFTEGTYTLTFYDKGRIHSRKFVKQ